MAFADIEILRADNSSHYQLSFQTGARSARHSLGPQTTPTIAINREDIHSQKFDAFYQHHIAGSKLINHAFQSCSVTGICLTL